MKIFIICPDKWVPKEVAPFHSVFDDGYAKKLIKHLTNEPSVCTGCGDECVNCRKNYHLNFSEDIVGIHKLPAELLYYIDDPEKYLPAELPPHDILLAINVHEDILLALPKAVKKAGAKGIIAPIEHPDWLTRWARNKIKQICAGLKLECAFPKPFCSLEKNEVHPHINKFINYFRVGKPEIEIEIKNGVIKNAKVIISAPCGATYFVAHKLIGKKLNENIDGVVAKYWHSYPCIASMKMDPELGDTILHKGGYTHYNIVHKAIEKVR
ncbi:DUF166 family protein [Candidatus Oleimmundimicrobium sp.]|uniref:DUF166 domain-containing protein n=1 Tax=Candidatus Oleimmundimicrobium sp. TaxID=3060597 RepID=UPI00280C2AE3|nr:DUF166 family protein [Candidatus Oleimmundimicrobium sp.]